MSDEKFYLFGYKILLYFTLNVSLGNETSGGDSSGEERVRM